MAETAEIANVANRVSKEIFEIFGWKRRPHKDLNFPCTVDDHNRKTHPSDVVFSYSNPLEENEIFLNTDLKSYNRDSINATKVSSAINNLISAVDCANGSPTWRDRYCSSNINYDVHGLLFVYNHDNRFEREWSFFLADSKIYASKLKKGHRIYVLGPPDIFYLLCVADDITRTRGGVDKTLPEPEFCKWHYPDLVNTRVKCNLSEAATLEILTSPWQVLRYEKGGLQKDQSGIFCYYKGTGKSTDEFKFLLDYLFRFQLVSDNFLISVRMPFGMVDASGRFETAKEEYWKEHHSLPEFKSRLDRIKMSPVARVRDNFDETVLGMD